MRLAPGTRLRSLVSDAELVVVKAPATEVTLSCGGAPMVALDDERPPTGKPDDDGELLLGKRYADEASGIELLCSKPGRGSVAADGRVLALKGAKPLPASD